MLNQQVNANSKKSTTNIWESMGLDQHLTQNAIALRKATSQIMEDNYAEINRHVDGTTFPQFLVDKFKPLNIGGMNIKGYGSPGLNTMDCAAIYYEMAKKDGSFALFYLAHHALGMAIVNKFGDEQQK